MDKNDDDIPSELLYRSLTTNPDLRRHFSRAWPILDPGDLVGDLWSVPAYLHRCAPWLGRDEIYRLQRAEPRAWTLSDLPLLDAARQRLGDPQASRRAQLRRRTLTEQREYMDDVVDYILSTDDDPDSALPMLRGDDLRTSLLDDDAVPSADRNLLDGPFAHVIVDEAQDLTDAQWQMLLRRCPSRSFTIVGDRAQSRSGFDGNWDERLHALGVHDVRLAGLTINYRTPVEIMDQAEKVIRSVIPDADVPTSVRSTGIPVHRGTVDELDAVLNDWLATHPTGTACVLDSSRAHSTPGRVSSLTPELAKGLEFDLVVLIEDSEPQAGVAAVVDRYVAMTRATQMLVILTGPRV